jgi:metal-dependent amidase/aminoacylase/carboxypeptidase family protein
MPQAAAEGCGFAPQHMPQAHPQLHNPDYDFPDALIAPVVRLFMAILARALGQPLS